jgi:hypothetical protein
LATQPRANIDRAQGTLRPPRRFRLTDVRGCRRELAAVYAEARNAGGLDWQAAARAARILQVLTRMIEGSTLEARIEAIEAALADHAPAKPNGSGRRPELRP